MKNFIHKSSNDSHPFFYFHHHHFLSPSLSLKHTLIVTHLIHFPHQVILQLFLQLNLTHQLIVHPPVVLVVDH
jgi:hypothetical protein